uniref:transporter n=1 Tax=Acinetobacter ursingii TaxID=108980 RepID=UPI0035A231A1
MTDQKLLGGQLGFYGIQPFVDVRLSAAGFSDSNKGLGDFVFAPLLAWHHGNPRWRCFTIGLGAIRISTE